MFNETEVGNYTDNKKFACNATETDMHCKFYYEFEDGDKSFVQDNTAKREFISNECKCALDGRNNSGYCSFVAGTKHYERTVAAV